MREQAVYINSKNERVEFGNQGILLNYNDLRDWSWSFSNTNDRISNFVRAGTGKTLPLIICCHSEDEGQAIKDRVFEVMEYDILTGNHGRIVVGDYYLKCFVTASKKSDYLLTKRYLKTSLTVTTDFPAWVKETTTIFRPMAEGTTSAYLGFSYDFPIDFTNELCNQTLTNGDFTATNFRMVIYGTCTNPTIYIGGHRYKIDVELSENEYLTVDSVAKTIQLTRYNGIVQNKFAYRDRTSYIFEPIPSGGNIVTWEGDFGFDITLLEERSEPKWI